MEIKATSCSELEFHGELYQSGRGGAYHASKVRIVDLSVDRRGTVKLGVGEGVESFDPDVKRFRFGKTHCLGHLHVKVLDPRAVEESAGRISELTERFRGEKRGVKRGLGLSGIGFVFERPGRDW